MRLTIKILLFQLVLFLLATGPIEAQPVWVTGTPVVNSTGPVTIDLGYGLDRTGTVYVIVYNYNNTNDLTSSYVRYLARIGTSGNLVETAVMEVKRADVGQVRRIVLEVRDPDQIHTIFVVAADSRGRLQQYPVRLNATTLPCPGVNPGIGGDECDLDFVLNAVPSFGTGNWTRVSGPGNASFSPDSHSPDATVRVTVYGTYQFRWTETVGECRSSGDITVNFYQPPVANAGRGGSECDLDFNLNAVTLSDDVNGTWTMTGGTGSAVFTPDAHSPSTVVRVSEYGRKVFTWTVISGPCTDDSEVTVEFNQAPEPDAGEDENNCGLEYYLNATPSTGTGTWSRVSGPGNAVFRPDVHDPSALVTVNEFGTYVFRWTEVNGECSAGSTVTIGFFEQGSANAGNGGHECDRTFTLNAVAGPGTGIWSMVDGPGSATFNPGPDDPDATVTVSAWGSYDFAWTEVSSNCTSTDIIRVDFHAPPEVSAGQDLVTCRGTTVTLNGTGTGTFAWSPAGLLSNPAIPNPQASPSATTEYTVTLTDQWGCRNSDRVTVAVRDIPEADAGPDQELEYMFETILAASELNAGETGEWKVLSGTANFTDRTSNSTEVTELSMGENVLLWSVDNGACDLSTDTMVVRIKELIIPTLITPNLDGNNDLLVINGIESIGITRLVVFNRWGAVVFSSDDYKNDWDGKDNNGNMLPPDTYFYLLSPEKIIPIKGYIVIRR